MNIQPITTESCIVRNTASGQGRTTAVEPGRTAARHLHYGRIILNEGDPPLRFETKDRETSLIGLKGSAQVKTEGNVVQPRQIRRDLCASRRVDRGHAGRRRLRYRRGVVACRQAASGAVRRVQRRAEGSRAAFRRGRSRLSARAEHSDREERRGRPADGRRDVQRAGQLDVVASARARGAGRRGVSLHRHAGAGVRHPARLHQQDRSRSGDDRARRATSC